MKWPALHLLILIVVVCLMSITAPTATAQSQSLNGVIEGRVVDSRDAPVTNATVTAVNTQTGSTRIEITGDSGTYRMPLLPLGTYRITADALNFKRLVREGIVLTTGQSATIDLRLEPGEVRETVTISADAPIADPGKTDNGRVINSVDVKNLPLTSRNPYNFAFLQPGVNGGTRPDIGVPRINANGYARRVNYLLDGNTATQSDRAGVRLMTLSETFVSEVQLITNNISAEFGNTPGLVMNVITPSGTNRFDGVVSYRFSRTPLYARPFFYSSASDLPENNTDNFSAFASGPIIKDRWHISGSYELLNRDDNISRIVNIQPSHRETLIGAGLPSSIFVPTIPVDDEARFYFLRSDAQITKRDHLTVRFNRTDDLVHNLLRGDLNTLERSTDTTNKDHSVALQLTSVTSRVMNEFRFQFARRLVRSDRNDFSGTGPTVVIRDVATFGAPDSVGTISPLEKVIQFQNNVTISWSGHALKIGGGFNVINDMKRAAIFARYVFPSLAAYLAARTGMSPRSYSTYEETFGDPETRYTSVYWNAFAQDDWKVAKRAKISFGLRYDLYRIPKADPTSPLIASREFRIDCDNFAPRFAIAYAIRDGKRALVLRAGAGVYFEQPWLNMYERALLNNGNPRFASFTISASNPGSPAFPQILGSIPSTDIVPLRDVDTVSPDFKNLQAAHFNAQLEQAINAEMSLAIGFSHSSGSHIAVYRNVNVFAPQRYLADGRPVFSLERLDPRFNVIRMAESVGNSDYDALTLQLTKRFSHGVQFSAIYTLSKATDDAPEQNLFTPPFTNLVLSDPTDRRRDRGPGFADQRHTFVLSAVVRPKFSSGAKLVDYVLNGNQIGMIMTANSGERFNITSNIDLNLDGINGSDRPVGIGRNSGKTPSQFNLDLLYSRSLNVSERYRLEVFADVMNIFNINNIVSYTNLSVATDPLSGNLLGPLPDFRTRGPASLESRQAQIGIKLHF